MLRWLKAGSWSGARVLQLSLVARVRDRGQVRRDRREVEEERVARSLDELDCLVGQHGRRIVLGLVPVVLEVAVVVDRVVVVGLHRDAVHDLPVVPARRDRVVDEVVRVGVDVLADEPGLVARVVHPDAEVVRLLGGVEGGVAVRPEVVGDPGVVRVLAREDARPRRSAHRGRHVRVREGDAVVGEQGLDVLHHGCPVGALVVAEDHDDVEPLVVGVLGRRHGLSRRRTGGAEDAQDEQQRRRHPNPHHPPHERLQVTRSLYGVGETRSDSCARSRSYRSSSPIATGRDAGCCFRRSIAST